MLRITRARLRLPMNWSRTSEPSSDPRYRNRVPTGQVHARAKRSCGGLPGERVREIFLHSDIEYRRFYLEGALHRREIPDPLNQRYYAAHGKQVGRRFWTELGFLSHSAPPVSNSREPFRLWRPKASLKPCRNNIRPPGFEPRMTTGDDHRGEQSVLLCSNRSCIHGTSKHEAKGL